MLFCLCYTCVSCSAVVVVLQERAVRYLFEHLDQLAVWGDILQMSVLELIRKVGIICGVLVRRGGGTEQP